MTFAIAFQTQTEKFVASLSKVHFHVIFETEFAPFKFIIPAVANNGLVKMVLMKMFLLVLTPNTY